MAACLHKVGIMLSALKIPLPWSELLRRTAKEVSDDDCLGLAAQLAYYFFLALFPAVLFLLALASFFPLDHVIDDTIRLLRPVAPADVLSLLEEQLRRVSDSDSGGILTIGFVGAVWSSSAALIAIVSSLNRAYDIEEARPWWKVRLIAIGLTATLAIFVLASFTLIVAGPTLAEYLAAAFGLGPVFEWTWKIAQWPLAFALVSTAIGLVYYFAPDAEQDWLWITPGALLGTTLWVVSSLAFKYYVTNFGDYNTYGAVGGVIVLMLWFYISGLAVLIGAELNAEIEHASPHGKAPGEKVPGERLKIGPAGARAYEQRLRQRGHVAAAANHPTLQTPRRPFRALGLLCRAAHHARSLRQPAEVEDRMPPTPTQSLGDLFADLSRDLRTLVEQEVHLIKTELGQKVAHAGRHAGLLVAGGLVAYAGLLTAIAGAVLVMIRLGLGAWIAASLAGIVVMSAGYVLIRLGLSGLAGLDLLPRQALESLKEDVQWLKRQTK